MLEMPSQPGGEGFSFLFPPPVCRSACSILQNGHHQLVISLDLLQKDHIEGGGVKSQQLSGPLIVDHLRDLLLYVSSQLKDLKRQEL